MNAEKVKAAATKLADRLQKMLDDAAKDRPNSTDPTDGYWTDLLAYYKALAEDEPKAGSSERTQIDKMADDAFVMNARRVELPGAYQIDTWAEKAMRTQPATYLWDCVIVPHEGKRVVEHSPYGQRYKHLSGVTFVEAEKWLKESDAKGETNPQAPALEYVAHICQGKRIRPGIYLGNRHLTLAQLCELAEKSLTPTTKTRDGKLKESLEKAFLNSQDYHTVYWGHLRRLIAESEKEDS